MTTNTTLIAAVDKAIRAPEIQKLPLGKAIERINEMPSGYDGMTIGRAAEFSDLLSKMSEPEKVELLAIVREMVEMQKKGDHGLPADFDERMRRAKGVKP